MKKPTRLLSTLLFGTFLSFGFPPSAQAQTLSYTNSTADAWLTPSSWTPANDWSIGAVKTNAMTANVRLNIGTVSNSVVAATYDATMGTTIFTNGSGNTIGMVIGAGNGTTGTVSVVGGTLLIRNGNQNQSPSVGGLLVGNAAAREAVKAELTLSGGNLIFTNGSGFSVMSMPYRGGSTNGGATTNFASGTFTIGNGSTATIERIFFGFNQGDTAAKTTGDINLNAGGTLSTRAISGRDGDASQMTARLNFNGGTLQVLGPNVAAPTVAFIQDANTGSNLTVNVMAGGATIDTAGFNATSNEGLLDAGGGGSFTKNGLGTLTLTQTNTYTGPTVLNGGSLSAIYPLNSSGLTLADGTTLSLSTRDQSWTNTVTSVTNAAINLALGAVSAIPSASTAVINTGTLNVSGMNVINITSGSGLTPGLVKLIDYTSSGNRVGGGVFVLGTLAPGLQATLIDGPNDVSLNVTLSVQSLIWTVGAGDWQTNGLANWNSGAGTYLEYPSGVGDVANFTDAAGVFYTVNLTSDVKPALANVNITNAAVTFSGAGRIVGTNGLTKSGTGILSLANTNIYDGVTSVENGTLQVFNDFALGSSVGETVVGSSGALAIGSGITVSSETARISGPGFGGSRGALRGADNGDNIWAGPIVLGSAAARIGTEDSGKLTVSGPISDGGSNYTVLYRPGNSGGIVIAAGSGHTYGGATATFGGTVKLGASTGFSTNALQVGAGTVDLNGFNPTVGGLFEFPGGGPGVILNNGGSSSILTLDVAGTNILDGTALIQDGAQSIGVVKSGGGRQDLTSTIANTYTGNTEVYGGELRLRTTLANSPVIVHPGGLLSVGTSATVNGTITVFSGGTLSLGAPFFLGVLTNTSAVSLQPGSTCAFHLDAGNTNLSSRLYANFVDYFGVTLAVTNMGATPITNGQVFQLVSAVTPSANFANAASVAIYPAGTGTFNPATGELTITAIPTAPTLNVVPSGNSLQFSWDNLNGVYHLQAQTNALSVGISTNWFNYPGGNTNSVTVPIDAANGAAFYRLVAP